MSAEKTKEAVDETNHGIAVGQDAHYPVVAEGTGKTLDTAAGAQAKNVHNVSEPSATTWLRRPLTNATTILPGRAFRRHPRVQDREVEQRVLAYLFCRLHCLLLRLRQWLRRLSYWFHHGHGVLYEDLRHRAYGPQGLHHQLTLLGVSFLGLSPAISTCSSSLLSRPR